jgi:hypothetical protein
MTAAATLMSRGGPQGSMYVARPQGRHHELVVVGAGYDQQPGAAGELAR